MLPFLRFFLIAGVAIGAVTTLFLTFPGSEPPMAELSPTERQQLRNQGRQRDPDRNKSGMVIEAIPATTVDGGFSSGLTLEERQALREQVRGVNPHLMIDNSAMSGSVAVNESYPDGVSNPVIDRGGYGGSNR